MSSSQRVLVFEQRCNRIEHLTDGLSLVVALLGVLETELFQLIPGLGFQLPLLSIRDGHLIDITKYTFECVLHSTWVGEDVCGFAATAGKVFYQETCTDSACNGP